MGCDMCGSISNGAISVGETGKARLNPEANLGDQAVVEAIKLAAQTCPASAIVLDEVNA